jgi:hypothetical protein
MATWRRGFGFRTVCSGSGLEVALRGDIATMRALDGPIV